MSDRNMMMRYLYYFALVILVVDIIIAFLYHVDSDAKFLDTSSLAETAPTKFIADHRRD